MSVYIELQENLLPANLADRYPEDILLHSLSAKSKRLDTLLEKLQDYSKRIGTSEDSKKFRKKLKDKLLITKSEFKEAVELIDKASVDSEWTVEWNFNEEMKKEEKMVELWRTCYGMLEKAIELVKEIKALEKECVEDIRRRENKQEEEIFDQKNKGQVQASEEVLEERENDIEGLRNILVEMNGMLEAIDIERPRAFFGSIIYHFYENRKKRSSIRKVRMAKAETEWLLFGVGVCVVVVVLLFLFTSSPESQER